MSEYYVVIDTNVVVSSLLKKGSIPWQVRELIALGRIKPLLNSSIINEYYDVLTRKKFSFDVRDVKQVIFDFYSHAVILEGIKSDIQYTDKNDAKFYELFLNVINKQNAFLITGNIKHFPLIPNIVTPRKFLEIYTSKEIWANNK